MMTRFFLYQGRMALAYALAALASAFGFRGPSDGVLARGLDAVSGHRLFGSRWSNDLSASADVLLRACA